MIALVSCDFPNLGNTLLEKRRQIVRRRQGVFGFGSAEPATEGTFYRREIQIFMARNEMIEAQLVGDHQPVQDRRRQAQRQPEDGDGRLQPVGGQDAQGGDQEMAQHHSCVSLTIRPSSILTVRPAAAAWTGEWVTIMMVVPAAARALQQFHHRLAIGGVQIAGGFVGQDQLGT